MSQPARDILVSRLRESLQALAEDGVDYLPRAAARSAGAAQTPRGTAASGARAAPSAGRAAPSGTRAAPSGAKATALAAVRAELGDCQRCGLCEKRKNIVFGEGSPEARVVFVGEGPGADEDRTGRPFVGKAGELLTAMIEALEWSRDDVYICNIVKCRPPGNRDPQLDEVTTCRPFLEQQLSVIQPKVIVTLGKPAASTLLGRNVAITKLRGQWQEWNGVPLMPTLHPAYVLRQYTRETRQAVWDDLRAVRERVDQS
jgi:DNA polymerase